MWTIILKRDEEEHDCVPNGWLVTPNKCLYPDKSKATVKKLAKECAPPEDNWDEIIISIVKRDLDVFERAFADVIRLETGKRSMTSSENEERGRGRRKLKRFSSEEYSSGSDIDVRRRDDSSVDVSRAGRQDKLSSAAKCISERADAGSSRAKCKTVSKSLNSDNGRQSKDITPKAAEYQCPLPKSRHVCTFSHGESRDICVAKQLCSVSRTLLALQSSVKDIQEQLKSFSVKSMGNEQRKDFIVEGSEQDEWPDEKIMEITKHLPFKAMEDFIRFEDRLKTEAELRNSTVLAFLSTSQKTSYTRMTTSILRSIISNEIIFNFTWKGQNRKDHNIKKLGFHNLAICSAVMSAVKKKWRGMVPNINSKLEICISGWFAQTQSKLNKK